MLPVEAKETHWNNRVDGCILVMNDRSLVSTMLRKFEHNEAFHSKKVMWQVMNATMEAQSRYGRTAARSHNMLQMFLIFLRLTL